MAEVAHLTTSDVLGDYYRALDQKGIPGPLAHDIVLDAAVRIHSGEISLDELPT